eukprot:1160091-Pelagomonas_calceolata.AAC.5
MDGWVGGRVIKRTKGQAKCKTSEQTNEQTNEWMDKLHMPRHIPACSGSHQTPPRQPRASAQTPCSRDSAGCKQTIHEISRLLGSLAPRNVNLQEGTWNTVWSHRQSERPEQEPERNREEKYLQVRSTSSMYPSHSCRGKWPPLACNSSRHACKLSKCPEHAWGVRDIARKCTPCSKKKQPPSYLGLTLPQLIGLHRLSSHRMQVLLTLAGAPMLLLVLLLCAELHKQFQEHLALCFLLFLPLLLTDGWGEHEGGVQIQHT